MTTPAHTAFGRYDVAIVGGGHNGLVAAAYLARAGLSVLVLERLERVGGAAVSAQPFAGRPTRLSRYADLVSLMPEQLMAELELDLRLASRPVASYTPVVRDGRHRGLLVERPEGKRTRTSFLELTDSSREYDAWCSFYSEVAALARAVEPTLLEPLPWEKDLAAHVDEATWRDFVTTPLGEVIEKRFADDTVRGVVATDALLGTFVGLHDASLVQNRCFLYQRLGGGTGEWRVPVGGMGAVTDALARAASEGGAEIRVGAGVSAIRAGDELNEIDFDTAGGPATVEARYVLANVAPWVLHILLGEPDDPETKPEGSQLTINFAARPAAPAQVRRRPGRRVRRHPARRRGLLPARSGVRRGGGGLPALDHAGRGALPLAHRPLDPRRRTTGNPHAHLLRAAHPGVGLRDRPGRTARTRRYAARSPPSTSTWSTRSSRWWPATRRASRASRPRSRRTSRPSWRCPGGHIFHGHLEWPWANNRARLDTPDQQWGVPTGLPRVFLAGAGARRGGAVSGIAGHNAAQAVLASR